MNVRQQVESEVKEVNNQFARLRGMPNAAHSLDLYGRSFSMAPVPQASRPNMRVRRSGRTSQGPRLKSAPLPSPPPPPPPLLYTSLIMKCSTDIVSAEHFKAQLHQLFTPCDIWKQITGYQ